MIDPTRTYSYRDICQDWVTVGAKHNYTQVTLPSFEASDSKSEKVPVPPYVPATVLTAVVAYGLRFLEQTLFTTMLQWTK